jgi:hypothetical protein
LHDVLVRKIERSTTGTERHCFDAARAEDRHVEPAVSRGPDDRSARGPQVRAFHHAE